MTVTAAPKQQQITDADLQQAIASIDKQIPNGPAFAALLGAGAGAFALGLLTTLAEASADVKNALVLNTGVGPLSGKTTYAVVVMAIVWALLAVVMRGKQYPQRPLFIATFVLIGLGFLGTFPIFFDLF